jgi:hypothetical protein
VSFKNLSRCLLCWTVLAISAGAMAQTRNTSNSGHPAQTGTIQMQGCVNAGPHGFTFFQTSTGTTFALPTADGSLARYRGKLVEITGTQAPPPAATGAEDLPRLTPSNVKEVGECPVQSFGIQQRPGATPSTIPAASLGTNGSSQSNMPGAATPEYASPGAPNQTPPTVRTNPNGSGATGAPSPGTGNPPPPQKPPLF